MYLFSCVLWAIFLVLFAPVLRQIARYLPHHRSENASKYSSQNHRTINSKQLLKSLKNLKIIRTFAHKVKNKRTKIYT